ncbi:UPF0551 family protein [Cavenderia fasciculata]|uniref:15-cis-phytoene synthase n=1 Tax=Cavenderia fasciculata TaxID=261658 RepID=F4Q3D4_CACFS|nr:UPF0551 family protein [Cavenderia fasciculata]EGG16803.1 UPF0551 family protein [Cavenderia fasciculata]|eukprot:XP_004355277.1 UPF0551 family protein [Cavenderia fasciculata]
MFKNTIKLTSTVTLNLYKSNACLVNMKQVVGSTMATVPSTSSSSSYSLRSYFSSSQSLQHGHSHGGVPCDGNHGEPKQQPQPKQQPKQHGHSHGGVECDGNHGVPKPQPKQQPKQHGHSHGGVECDGNHGQNNTAAASAAPSSSQQQEQQSNSKSISIKDLASKQDVRYVTDRLNKTDYESFICSILLSEEGPKMTSLATRTFNVETATDPSPEKRQMSKNKLAFWKDAINSIYNGRVYDQPLIRVLAQQIKERGLSKTWFIKLLNRRDKDLDAVQPKDLEELEAYSDDINTSLLMLTLESMGVKGNSDVEHAASHLGKAMGLVTLIRGTPYHIRTRKLYIPTSITNKYGIVAELLFQGSDAQQDKMKEAIFEMASRAKAHLDKARTFDVPSNVRQAFLQSEICENYLENLRQVDFDIYQRPDTSKVIYLKLLKNKLFKKF